MRLNFGIHRKRKAPMLSHRGQVPCSVCFAPLGDGKATSSHAHETARTSAPDAHSVTHSGKICGSPRFALFPMVRSSKAQTAEPRVTLEIRCHSQNRPAAIKKSADYQQCSTRLEKPSPSPRFSSASCTERRASAERKTAGAHQKRIAGCGLPLHRKLRPHFAGRKSLL